MRWLGEKFDVAIVRDEVGGEGEREIPAAPQETGPAGIRC